MEHAGQQPRRTTERRILVALLCDRASAQTRDSSQRQLPTDHDYDGGLSPIRGYQSDNRRVNRLGCCPACSIQEDPSDHHHFVLAGSFHISSPWSIRQLQIATAVNHIARRQVVADPDLWKTAAAGCGHATTDLDCRAPDDLRVVPALRTSRTAKSRRGIGHSAAGVGRVHIVGLFRSPALHDLCRRNRIGLTGEIHVLSRGLPLNRTVGVVPSRTGAGIVLGKGRQSGVPGHGR